MKKIFISAVVLCFFVMSDVFAQSILLTPNQLNSKQSSSTDNILLQGTNPPNIVGRRHNGSLAVPTATTAGLFPLSLEAEGYNGTAFTSTRGRINFNTTENWTTTGNGLEIQFHTTANATIGLSQRMVIGNNGNVGIGTGSPLSLLHVFQGTSGIAPNGNAKVFIEDNTDTYLNLAAPNANETGILFAKTSSSAHGGIIYTGANAMNFRTGGNNTRMTISSTGNVGIGTTTPTAKLDIEGDIVVKKSAITVAGTYNALNRLSASSIYFNTSGTINLNGIDAGVDGLILYIFCGGGTTLVIANENASASASDRIATHTGANVTISGRGGATLIYESTSARWRVVGVAQ